MNSVAVAALTSWNLNAGVIALLIGIAAIYTRGWLRGRRLIRYPNDGLRLGAFLAGLLLVFLANESPLDSFDNLFLSAHMTQHLLLMMFAPALILLGDPLLPLLRGLPKAWVKEGLGPFLSWPALRRFFGTLTSPPAAWLAFAISTIAWHIPRLYELALHSPRWHEVQHASFFWTGILFWWPIVRPGVSKSRWPLWVGIPYLMFSDLLNTALSAFLIFSGRVLYPTYEAVKFSGMTAREDQTLAGAIMWVPGSLVYLIPVVLIAVRLFSTEQRRHTGTAVRTDQRARVRRWKFARWRPLTQLVMLCVAIAVVIDGFVGPQVTPINLAGVLPWIHWRGLSILALLLVGNLFCMACPFTLVRDQARKILPARLRWPRVLRNKWLPIGLLLIYFWSYEAFSLWDRPWITAILIAGYFAAAVIVDGTFRGASFCKYVCPIGQFHFVSSLVSPREVGVRSPKVCASCTTYDCIRGNEKQRGCELYLFQPKKAGNLDCTFCLDCVKACPHDNVALIQVAPAAAVTRDPYRSSLGRLSKRTDLAALALIIVFAAFVNAAGMISPVMMWEHGWHARFGGNAMPLVVGAFVLLGIVAVPAAITGICSAFQGRNTARRFVYALVPLGFAMWAAHLLYHLVTSAGSAVPAITRALTGSVEVVPAAFLPPWLAPLQLLVLDAGLLLTLYIGWRIAGSLVNGTKRALTLTAPWAVVGFALYLAGVWILFQPMQMRGMMH